MKALNNLYYNEVCKLIEKGIDFVDACEQIATSYDLSPSAVEAIYDDKQSVEG